MKVYIVLEDYTNGEQFSEDHEEWHDVFHGCFSDPDKAWLCMNELAENVYKRFEERYHILPGYYSKPTTMRDVRYSIKVSMRYPSIWADKEECCDFRLVEMEV